LVFTKSVVATRAVSLDATVRFCLPIAALVTVTTFAAGLAAVKSACALITVKILSAVVSFDSFGRHPSVSAGAVPPAASDVKTTDVPLLVINVMVVPTAMFV